MVSAVVRGIGLRGTPNVTPDVASIDYAPDWLFFRPPHFANALRGVRYVFHFDHADRVNEALELEIAAGRWKLVLRFAAVGPSLFRGRSNGPWMRYDTARVDENAGTRVSERPSPWHLGDRLWELWVWNREIVFVDRSIDHSLELFVWPSPDVLAAARWVQRESERASEGKAVPLFGHANDRQGGGDPDRQPKGF